MQMKLRCLRCADRYSRPPTLLGWAMLDDEDVLLVLNRRLGKRVHDLEGRARQQPALEPAGFLSSAQAKTAMAGCHGCGLRAFAVVLERLRPALEAGYETVLVGANGEVVPVGAPGRLTPA
jgi:hypothetical protein